MPEFEIDIDKAAEMINIVQNWGARPEIKKDLAPARVGALNSMMGLVLTGIADGLFPDNEESNQHILEKLFIAFDFGYYARSLKYEV